MNHKEYDKCNTSVPVSTIPSATVSRQDSDHRETRRDVTAIFITQPIQGAQASVVPVE